jgi:hypothetical protein
MHEVLISYSTKDKQWADAACSVLESQGIRCWIAPRDIAPGAEWGAAIISGIDACKVMVLIFSASANGSPQVRREVERAISKGLTVVPCRVEDIKPAGAMEYALGNTHWLDVFTPPIEQQMERLAESVDALLPRGRGTPRVAGSLSLSSDLSTQIQSLHRSPVSKWMSRPKNRWIAAGGIVSILIVAASLVVFRPQASKDAAAASENVAFAPGSDPARQSVSIAKPPAVTASGAPARPPLDAPTLPGPKSLFNGTSLAGWQGDQRVWTVDHGAILGQGGHNPGKDRNGNTYLIHEEDYSDFELTLEFKLSNQGRSGVQFRSALDAAGQMRGSQAEIGFDDKGRWMTGSLIEAGTGRNFLKNRSEKYRPDDWNEMSIRCEGDHTVIKVNGFTTVDFRDPQGRRSGFFALQSDGGLKPLIAFRKIRVSKLTPAQMRPVDSQLAKKAAKDYETLATGSWAPLLATRDDFDRVLAENSYHGRPPKFDKGILDLRAPPKAAVHVSFSSPQAKNIIIRARVRKLSPRPPAPNDNYVRLDLRFSNGDFCTASLTSRRKFEIGRKRHGAKQMKVLTQYRLEGNYDEGFFELAFAAVDDMLIVYVEGRQIMAYSDPESSDLPAGRVVVAASSPGGRFRDIAVQVLDKPIEPPPTVPRQTAALAKSPAESKTPSPIPTPSQSRPVEPQAAKK